MINFEEYPTNDYPPLNMDFYNVKSGLELLELINWRANMSIKIPLVCINLVEK